MFGFISKGLGKTADAIKHIAPKKKLKISKDELEDILLETDIEYELVEIILREIHTDYVTREQLESKLLTTLAYSDYKEPAGITPPAVDLIIGVNGAGKTTTIAKLASRYKNQGHKVVLGASDTFRAAAIEQLTQWAVKLNVPIVSSKQGHDPSAVAYDAIESAKAKGAQHVIIDTAGRLHTQTNLANELKKIVRICDKAHNGAPHRKILVLDGTQGSSAIAQAKAFHDMIDIDGIIITKLDGTARGGSLFSIAYELKIPILYIGVGEQPEHLLVFNKYEFVSGLLDIIYFDEDEIALNVTELKEEDDLHVNFEAQMKQLHQRINKDGFDVLSRHFVREQSTWNEYRLVKNDVNGHYEILKRDGTVIKSYALDAADVAAAQPEVKPEPVEAAPVVVVKRIKEISADELKILYKKINADGYDVLSKHFVRDQKSWNEYKFIVNEAHNALEILNRDGSLRHSYGVELLEDAKA